MTYKDEKFIPITCNERYPEHYKTDARIRIDFGLGPLRSSGRYPLLHIRRLTLRSPYDSLNAPTSLLFRHCDRMISRLHFHHWLMSRAGFTQVEASHPEAQSATVRPRHPNFRADQTSRKCIICSSVAKVHKTTDLRFPISV